MSANDLLVVASTVGVWVAEGNRTKLAFFILQIAFVVVGLGWVK